MIERQITAIDSQIDLLVYDLYGLTDEEIKLVESTAWCGLMQPSHPGLIFFLPS